MTDPSVVVICLFWPKVSDNSVYFVKVLFISSSHCSTFILYCHTSKFTQYEDSHSGSF